MTIQNSPPLLCLEQLGRAESDKALGVCETLALDDSGSSRGTPTFRSRCTRFLTDFCSGTR
jgi:hypothetical protein